VYCITRKKAAITITTQATLRKRRRATADSALSGTFEMNMMC